jgi:hypothetical protein
MLRGGVGRGDARRRGRRGGRDDEAKRIMGKRVKGGLERKHKRRSEGK